MIRRVISLAVLLILCGLPALAMAQTQEPPVFDNAEQEERYKELTTELRCVVCQNQNLADSDAQLAQDLRKEILGMLKDGQSDDQITGFLVDRYGDFVLYRPAIGGNTLALWLIPGILLGFGAIAVFFTVRNRNRRLAEQRQEGSS